MCDLIDFILSGSEIYYDLYHNIIKTPFNGLEPFQLCPSKIINHRDDARGSHNPSVTSSSMLWQSSRIKGNEPLGTVNV